MRNPWLALALCAGVIGSTSILATGCSAMMQSRASEQAYNPSTGTQTIAFNNGIYQSRGEALPLKDDQLAVVGTAEGYNLYRLKGGGAGGTPQADMLYIKTTDGRYQALVRVQ